ncbi:MAG: MFS transporter [Hamadaea sp.]|nr:MFS transporter [Hamadaea sp.]NUT22308.1 MFS transporter [Hamadaea sp.]
MSLTATVWVLALGGSSELASLAGLCVYLPTLFGPLLGAVVDRVPRRRLLVWTSLVLALGLFSLLLVRGRGDLWLLYAVMLAYGVNYVLNDAAESALLPSAVSPDQLGRLNGWRVSAQESMKIIAPLAGAGLFAWQGGGAVAMICAAALVVSAVLYALIRADEPPRSRTTRAKLTKLPNAVKRTVMVAATAVAMSGFVTAAQLEVVTVQLGRPASFVGVLASLQGAGAIVGGLLAGRGLDRLSEVRFGVLGGALFTAGLVLRGLPWLPGVVAGALLAGIGLPWTVVAAMTAVQRHTPDELLGRISATATTLTFAPLAAAIPAGAGLVAVAGTGPALVIASILLLYALRSARPFVSAPGMERGVDAVPQPVRVGSGEGAGRVPQDQT